jgi:hypothetical protein
MSEPLTVPPPDQIIAEIEARRQEITELKKLLKVSTAAAKARAARERQHQVPKLDGGPRGAA